MTRAFLEQKKTIEKMDKRMESMEANFTNYFDTAINKFQSSIK